MDQFVNYDNVSFNARVWAAVNEKEFIEQNKMHFEHLNDEDKLQALKSAHAKCREAMGMVPDKDAELNEDKEADYE